MSIFQPNQLLKNSWIDQLTNAAWLLTSFYLSPAISNAYRRKTKKKIKQFLMNHQFPYDAYIRFCERLQWQLSMQSGNHCGSPQCYIPSGRLLFVVSEQISGQYEYIQKKGETLPVYCSARRALAEAILDLITEGPCEAEFWTAWFSERSNQQQLHIFNKCLLQLGLKTGLHGK
jgi:hypothetical protein